MRIRPEYLGRADQQLGAKGTLALLSKIAPGVATLTTNLLIGRLGGAALLGLTQTAMSTAALASLIYPGPASTAASRYVASSLAEGAPSKAASVARYLGRRVLFAVLVLSSAIIIVSMVTGNPNPSLVLVSCVMTASVSIRIFVEGLHFGGGQARRLAMWSTGVAAAGVAGSGLLILLGLRSVWVIVPVAVANIIFAAISWPTGGREPLDPTARRTIRHFLVLAFLGTITSSGFAQATTLVANITVGLSFAGQYAAAITLTTPLAIVATAISATLFPALSAMHTRAGADLVRERVHSASRLINSIMGAAITVLIILARPIVSIVWGPHYAETWWIFIFLLTATLATAVAVPAVTALTASSNKGMLISAISSLAGAAVGVALWCMVIPLSGPVGVIIGCAAATITSGLVPYILIWRRYRMAWARITVELLLAVLISWTVAGLAHFGLIPDFVLPVFAALVFTGWCFLRRRDVSRVASTVADLRRRS